MRNLPFFPDYPTPVTALLESCREGDTVVYFFKGRAVFSHHVQDVHTFHMITAQFCVRGHAQQEDIVRAYRVPAEGVRLAVELYRAMGPVGFYPESEPSFVPSVLPSRAPKGTKPEKRKAVKFG